VGPRAEAIHLLINDLFAFVAVNALCTGVAVTARPSGSNNKNA